MNDNKTPVNTRPVTKADAEAIVALDAEVTGEDKAGYWSDILDRFTAADQRKHQCFLVATAAENEVVGFIVGEIRAWEFGSPPCGWVLAMSVSPGRREQGIGAMLLSELCTKLKKAGVATIRTMVLGNDKVNLSFFRGEGLAAGPYIELEKRLD